MSGLANAELVSVTYLNNSFLTIGVIDVQLAAGEVWTRKINILGGTYVLDDIDLKVSVLDEVVGSPTNGYWLAADAVVTKGWKNDGNLIVINEHSTPLKLRITAKATRSDMGLLVGE